jgi:nucleotide-binding universal stress UspA family protein
MHALMATDGSERSVAAIRLAAKMLRLDRATVLIVSDGRPDGDPSGSSFGESSGEVAVHVRAARAAIHDVEVDELVLNGGDPGDRIVRAAEEQQPDVVVVGSHGRGFLRRTLLGSVSEHVVRHCPVPVLVIPNAE